MVPTKFMMTNSAISGTSARKLSAQRSGRNGFSVARSNRAPASPGRDSGSTNSARQKFTALSAAARMNGARTHQSPSSPPSTGPTMKPMPNMAWK